MMRTETGRTKYGHKREGNTGHGEHRSDITPPSLTVRPALYTIQLGGGVGSLEASRDTETGQDRRPPGQRPFRDPRRSGELGQPWRSRGFRKLWWDRLRGRGPSPHPGLSGLSGLSGWSPTTPHQNFLGESRGSIRHLGALWKSGHLGALWKRRHS